MSRRRVSDSDGVPASMDEELETADEVVGSYFLDPEVECFSSGCEVLNRALGNGWPMRRMINVVGDKSTGKTLLMIEAAAQFIQHHKGDAEVVYCECEAAFDKKYAEALGMPLRNVRFIGDEYIVCKKGASKKKTADGSPAKVKWWRVPSDEYDPEIHDLLSDGVYTVEQLEHAMLEVIADATKPTLFIVDSYDALSDSAELGRDPSDKATYAMEKAKYTSAMFRRINKKLASSNVTLAIVSQTRANIGVVIGKKHTRSGGKALDFYATHVVWLQKLGNLERTRKKVRRVYGVEVRAKVEKNKVALPAREAIFPIIFGYGIEECISMIDWLVSHGKHGKVFASEAEAAKTLKRLDSMGQREYDGLRQELVQATRAGWREVESEFLPTRRKYATQSEDQQ